MTKVSTTSNVCTAESYATKAVT